MFIILIKCYDGMKSVMLGECGNRGRSGGWYCHSEGEKTHKYKWKNDEAIGREEKRLQWRMFWNQKRLYAWNCFGSKGGDCIKI